YQDQGRYREALELQTTGLRVREEIGDRPGIAMSYGNIGFVHLDLGETASAREFLSKSVQMQQALGMKTLLSATTAWLALATAESGELQGGLALARGALTMATGLGQKWFEGIACRSVGIILRMIWAEGSPGDEAIYTESAESLRRSFSLFTEGHFEHEAARSACELGRLLKMGGEIESGERYIQQGVEIFQKLGAMGDLDRVLHSTRQ
ncbi:MAG: tetratricopeptide repeat protein, partial [candidate division NC10 bacterium]|nr:tetratricopeptide repeat protein [candidate division NC10 bacterium]